MSKSSPSFLRKLHSPKFAAISLRVGLAVIFMYAAISSFTNPEDWVGYLPSLLTEQISAGILLKFFSAYELVLAAWLLSGVFVRYAALLAAATLGGIIVSNFSLFTITFRDIALVFAAIALFLVEEE